MLSPEDVESLRRSHAMAPLGAHQVQLLLEECDRSARQWRELVEIVAELREAVPPLRETITKMALLGSTARDRQMAIVMAGELARRLVPLRAALNRLARVVIAAGRGRDA